METNARVLWFNEHKGCGHAITDDNQTVFLHYSAIDIPEKFKTLHPAQEIRLTIDHSGSQLIARKIYTSLTTHKSNRDTEKLKK